MAGGDGSGQGRDLPEARRVPDRIVSMARTHRAQYDRLESDAQKAVERRLAAAAERAARRMDSIDASSFRAQQDRIVRWLAEHAKFAAVSSAEPAARHSAVKESELAASHVNDEMRAWADYYGQEFRPLNLRAIVSADEQILMQKFDASLKNWGAAVAAGVQGEIATGLAAREDSELLKRRVQRVIGAQRWKANRIVRTELSHAYNRSHNASLRQYNATRIPNTQRVQKSAIATFDQRTDPDSYPVHGQVKDMGQKFEDGEGREYLHPPGRPNDRESEIPHFPDPAESDAEDEPIGAQRSERARQLSEPAEQALRRGERKRTAEGEETRSLTQEFADVFWPGGRAPKSAATVLSAADVAFSLGQLVATKNPAALASLTDELARVFRAGRTVVDDVARGASRSPGMLREFVERAMRELGDGALARNTNAAGAIADEAARTSDDVLGLSARRQAARQAASEGAEEGAESTILQFPEEAVDGVENTGELADKTHDATKSEAADIVRPSFGSMDRQARKSVQTAARRAKAPRRATGTAGR